MWPIVCKNALGLVLMVNNKEEDCLAQIQWYADKFRTQLNEIPAVLAITQTDVAKTPTTKDYKRVLKEKGITIPVFSIDARKKSDVLIILNAVLSMNEAEL
jgi:signal recognition particle receptor subunit beta